MATNNGTLIKTYEILKMKNKNKVQFQKLTERFQKIRKKLFEEWKLKYPSYYPLESCATDIVQLLKETQIEDEEFEFWKSWKIREIDIFKADLVGELHHDYDKRLVRYKGKWDKEKAKIDSLISEFRQKFGNRTE